LPPKRSKIPGKETRGRVENRHRPPLKGNGGKGLQIKLSHIGAKEFQISPREREGKKQEGRNGRGRQRFKNKCGGGGMGSKTQKKKILSLQPTTKKDNRLGDHA